VSLMDSSEFSQIFGRHRLVYRWFLLL
jgi:hypothetical protein